VGYAEAARSALVLRPAAFRANADDVAGLYAAAAAQSPLYAGIGVPATVIGGDADRIVWTDLHARSFARAVPDARLVVLPGAGHMPHHTHPEAVVAEIDALAGRVRGHAAAALPPGR
jgi:pimeloyl-ACP methyl ester carboxylesterase